MPAVTISPGAVVQQQLDAGNRRDLTAWLALLADDASQWDYAGNLLVSGKHAMAAMVQACFRDPAWQMHLLHRAEFGQMVVDHVLVAQTRDGKPILVPMLSMHELSDGRIRKVTLVGQQVADGHAQPLVPVSSASMGKGSSPIGAAVQHAMPQALEPQSPGVARTWP